MPGALPVDTHSGISEIDRAMLDATEIETVDHERLLKDVSTLSTQFDLLRFLKRCTELFRTRAFIVLRVPGATAHALQAVSVISSWPSEMLSKYDSEGLLKTSAVIQRIRNSSLPFQYDVGKLYENRGDPQKEHMIEFFTRYHMPRGAYFPVSDPAGDRAGIGFSGDREPFTSYEMLQLHMISTHAFERLYHIDRRDQRVGEDLTQREIDCLNWTAAGKTSVEISDILSLSEHTVNHYLNRATKKLDTVNRTQAVAKALRMGIIT
jgi:LuxR family transcriptional regulator, quorum-sensing system regulator BjaR1